MPDSRTTAETLTAALHQNEAMTERLARIDDAVAKLAHAMTGDRVQPSGRWGGTEEMLAYLTELANADA